MAAVPSSVQRCALCKGADALVELPSCGHTYHPRCVYAWPITICQVCHAPTTDVRLLRRTSSEAAPPPQPRRVWHACEKEYCDILLALFLEGSLPIGKGMHLRPMLAALLHCNPMRITKKFKQSNQLGKQAYAYHATDSHSYKRHVQTQRHLTTLRDAFYWQVQAHGGGHHVVDAMRHAELQFWLGQLHPFCKYIGQVLEPPKDVVYKAPATSSDDALRPSTFESPALPASSKASPDTSFTDNDDLRVESPVHVEHAAEARNPQLQLEWEDVEIVSGPWAEARAEECSLGFIIDENGLVQFESMYVDDSVWSQ
ncbi:hypothetical protein ACHHYP_12595 [Achlya hypogyna]|uniref:RING-type domain-containing protein n=1 Tax=Achlya hypogyna TaxID=1202772 RepID=A0A1V9YGU7_ACHHY|nr:hypothetical protein ACHHYP_12595 [Achlya hypogyna]